MMEMDLRQFDPAIARWTSIDPVTHYSNSTFNGFDNNPIYWADPSGADATNLINNAWNNSGSGATTWTNNGNGTFSGSEECPSCKTEEDWENYYSQGYNTAGQLGVLDTVSKDGYTFHFVRPNDRLSTSTDKDGHTLFYLDGELQDLQRYDNYLDALSSFLADGLNPEAPGKLFKYVSKFFKRGGDKVVKGSMATQTFDNSTELVEGLEFSGIISGTDGVMNVEIEMLQKISGTDANANLLKALEVIGKNNRMSQINIVGNVVNEQAASKAAAAYIKAGYNVSTKTTKSGMTQLTRTKKLD